MLKYISIAVVVALAMVLFRFDVVESDGVVVYRLDRWTGDMQLVSGITMRDVEKRELLTDSEVMRR